MNNNKIDRDLIVSIKHLIDILRETSTDANLKSEIKTLEQDLFKVIMLKYFNSFAKITEIIASDIKDEKVKKMIKILKKNDDALNSAINFAKLMLYLEKNHNNYFVSLIYLVAAEHLNDDDIQNHLTKLAEFVYENIDDDLFEAAEQEIEKEKRETKH